MTATYELLEMLPQDVADRLAAGNDIAVVPIWSIEQHGPHLLLGTDSYFAQAVAREIGRLSGAAVLPPIPFSWVGCTNAFSGGVGVRESVFVDYLRAVVTGLWRAGFRRIVIYNCHGGNWAALNRFPHDVLLEDGIPVMTVYGFANCREAVEAERKAGGGEATGLAGGLRLLGREDLVKKVVDNTLKAVAEFGDRPKVLFEPKSARESRRLGAVGHDYSHECYHVQPDSGVNPDAGAEAATKIAAHIVSCFQALGRYVQRLIDEGVVKT